jgi:hypothetical protein
MYYKQQTYLGGVLDFIGQKPIEIELCQQTPRVGLAGAASMRHSGGRASVKSVKRVHKRGEQNTKETLPC